MAAALLSDGGAATAPDLAPALTELKANLAAEMRAVSEEHFLLLRLLLSPTQVTVFRGKTPSNSHCVVLARLACFSCGFFGCHNLDRA